MTRLITRREVVQITGRSPSTIYRDEKAGHFPARRRLPGGAARWLLSEVEAWLESLPKAADADQAPTNSNIAGAAAARVTGR